MSYSIKNVTETSIFLYRNKPRSTSFAQGISALFIIVGMVVSLGLIATESYGALITPGIMFLAGCIGMIMPNNSTSNDIKHAEKIEFDNVSNCIKVYMTKKSLKAGYIPYDSIETIEIKKRCIDSKSNKYAYDVHMLKKDSGIWQLSSFVSEAEAIAFQNPLNSCIKSATTSPQLPEIELPEKFVQQKTYEGIGFQWTNSAPSGLLLLILMTLLFGIIELYLILIQGYFSLMFVFFTFFFLILLLCTYFLIDSIIEYSTTRYAILINAKTFIYRETSKRNGKLKKETIQNISDLSSLHYSFDFNFSDPILYLDTKENQQKQLDTKKEKSMQSFFSFYKSFFTLKFTALNPVETIELERWIQGMIQELSSKEIL